MSTSPSGNNFLCLQRAVTTGSLFALSSVLPLVHLLPNFTYLQSVHIYLLHAYYILLLSSVQFSRSVGSNSLRPRESQHARPPVHHQLLEFNQTHVHRVSDAIQPSQPLSSPSPSAPNPSQLRVFSNESTLPMRWPKYWSFSFSIIPSKEIPGLISFRMDWLDLLAVARDSQESSPTPQFKTINSSVLSLLHSPTLTSIHDHWKNHSLD